MSETASRPFSRRYSVAALILLIPWVALVIDAWTPIRDNSFLWHIRAGELQSTVGTVLQQDPFSFTRLGADWLTQSWLAELGYAWGESTFGGLGFVPWMLLAMTTVTFVGIALVSYRRSQSLMTTAIVSLLTVVLMISFLVPRPVLFSFALFAGVVVSWEASKGRWALPFLFWIWASVHGSFVIGLAYLGLSLIARKEWKWLPTVIVSGLVTLAMAGHKRMNEKIPGRNETYRQEIDRIKKETREEIGRSLSAEQQESFADTRIGPLLGDTGGTLAFTTHVSTDGPDDAGAGIMIAEEVAVESGPGKDE